MAAVLVVDDEPSIRFVLEKALGKAGFDVVCAASAEEARERLAERRFEVALLDVRLPGRSGFELLEEIRAAGRRPFVVVMTAQDTLRAAVNAMRLGAEDYLVKPFDLDRLVQVVSDLAGRAGAPEATPGAEPTVAATGCPDPLACSSKGICVSPYR